MNNLQENFLLQFMESNDKILNFVEKKERRKAQRIMKITKRKEGKYEER